MKKLILAFVLIISISFSYAQKVVAVLNGTTWTFYEDFSPALRAAPAGSIIYVPGGTFDLGGSDTINKPITIIGVGHYPDSTVATQRTLLNGAIYFSAGGNNVYICGLEIGGSMKAVSGSVYNINVNRCKFGDIYIGESTGSIFNLNIIESVFDVIIDNTSGIKNVIIEKSILRYLYSVDNVVVKNSCIIGYYVSGSIIDGPIVFIEDGYFENNIIINWADDSTITNTNNVNHPNIFYNNVMSGRPLSLYSPLGTIRLNNIYFATLANTFVSVGSPFTYNYDYHLLSTSTGKNAGTDGTDIGFYGGAYPYKEGAVPPNPHISTKSISPTSAANGTLPVNIKVVAQDR